MKEIKLINTNLCNKILNQEQVAELSQKILAIRMLTQIQIYIGGDLRISWQGVPHLLYPNNIKSKYSICYFRSGRNYRIFYPYPSETQNKLDFITKEEVINYLEKNENDIHLR